MISWTNDRQLPNPEPVDIAEELELDTYAKKDEIPTKVSELTNDSGYLTTETDPTVSSWAKQPNKPSYTAQEVGAIDVAQKGEANGVAELDADGKVKSGQLPSYVDDVAEYDSMSQFPATGESGKIYIAKDTNITYRWGGSSYVPIGSDLALGETASTAYRGDRGKIAYDHASAKGNAYANGLYKIATNAEGHVTGATPVAKSDITGLGIPGSVPTKTSELQNDSGFITTETDPTVASWAKEPTKPTYTASEVGLGNVANERQYSANNPPPADTTKQNKINVNGILKGTGNGGVTAAVEGTDYISGDIIAVQDETPTDPNTQIWLPETQPESVQVASYAELTNVLNALNQKAAEPDGTKAAGKVYGLDENLDPAWVDLAGELDEKAPAIILTDESAYSHETDGMMRSLLITGNSNVIGNVRIANKKNILPPTNVSKSSDTFTFEIADYAGVIDGSKGSTIRPFNYPTSFPISAGAYKLVVIFDATGATTTNPSKSKFRTLFNVKYEGDSTGTELVRANLSSFDQSVNVYDAVFTRDATTIYLAFEIQSTSTFNNARFWYGLFPADVTIIDTGLIVATGETYNYTDIAGFNAVCSMQNKSILTYVADTKKYIDDKEIKIDDELTYIRPENPLFGAIGDGVTDDTSAINACIAFGIQNNIPVRAYKEYKVTGSVLVTGDHADIYINILKTSSQISALIIDGNYNRVEFNEITSDGTAIELIDGSSSNLIVGTYAMSTYDTIKLTPSNEGYIIYNTFRINRLNSANGNCISGPTETHDHEELNPDVYQSENRFIDINMRCPNGWAVYNSPGRYFNLGVETNVLNGVHIDGGLYTMVGWRYGELVNKIIDGRTGGILIKYIRGSFDFHGSRYIPYFAIDTSDSPDFDNISQTVKNARMWGGALINAPIKYGVTLANGYIDLGQKMILFGKKKICVPLYKNAYTITIADYDMRDANLTLQNCKPYPTRMKIGVADCVIHLSDSYCSMGYSEFVVDQSDDTKLCTIYSADDDTTPIFDGSTLGAGVYKLTANCDIMSSSPYGFTGKNDVWTIEKIS